MKTRFFSVLLFTCLLSLTVACKSDKNNETEAKEAVETSENTAEATKFMVDQSASTIEWKGKKPTGTHTGDVSLESGVVKVDGDNVSGTFLIDMKSINVTDLEGDSKTDLENHLKGTVEGKEGDFFNVQKFPTAAFEITGIEEKDGKKMMSGNLTIKEAKKNIEFPVTYSVNGNVFKMSSEPFTIDRTEWNVNYGSKSVFDNLGDKFINDDIELTINLTATKQS